MIERAYYLHYRRIRDVIVTAITVGTAFVASYFVLWARL